MAERSLLLCCVRAVGVVRSVKEIPGYGWMQDVPRLEPSKLVYIGLRDLDEFEKNLIKKMGIKTYTMQHIDKYGIGKVMEMCLDHLCGKVCRRLLVVWLLGAPPPPPHSTRRCDVRPRRSLHST